MDQVSQVREKIDIVSLITSYIPLKRAGRNFKVLCPFHSEKTPSFVVSPERQIWHCFGCGKGGDCFSFLMEYENLEFPEALRTLAKQAGVALQFSRFDTATSSKKERLFTLNRYATDFYHFILTKHNAGKRALTYLVQKRQLTLPLISTFKLGFAPGVGNVLSRYLMNKKGVLKEELVEAGLSLLRGSETLDFFKNRIMFPLFDHRGNIVGFSARVLSEEASEGSKYINTKDTLIYHKANNFFGIHVSKEEIKKTGKALVVEGEFDAMLAFARGIKNAVAIKGTALTDNQAQLLSRFAKKVALCFDQDAAGQEAIKRSLSALEQRGFATTVIVSQGGKDPDEILRKNPASFKRAVRSEVGVYDYLIAKALTSFDRHTAEGKKNIADEVLTLLAQTENEIVKEHYVRKLSRELDTSYESIARELQRIEKKQPKTVTQTQKYLKRSRRELLEEYLLALILQHDDTRGVVRELGNDALLFEVLVFRKLVDHLIDYLRKEEETFSSQQFAKLLPKELLPTFNTCFLLPKPDLKNSDLYKKEVERVAKELQVLSLRSKIKGLSDKIRKRQQQGQEDKLKNLHRELSTLISRLQEFSQL